MSSKKGFFSLRSRKNIAIEKQSQQLIHEEQMFSLGSAYPDEIVELILQRLPTCALVRMCLVSNSWRSRILSDDFLHRHSQHCADRGWLILCKSKTKVLVHRPSVTTALTGSKAPIWADFRLPFLSKVGKHMRHFKSDGGLVCCAAFRRPYMVLEGPFNEFRVAIFNLLNKSYQIVGLQLKNCMIRQGSSCIQASTDGSFKIFLTINSTRNNSYIMIYDSRSESWVKSGVVIGQGITNFRFVIDNTIYCTARLRNSSADQIHVVTYNSLINKWNCDIQLPCNLIRKRESTDPEFKIYLDPNLGKSGTRIFTVGWSDPCPQSIQIWELIYLTKGTIWRKVATMPPKLWARCLEGLEAYAAPFSLRLKPLFAGPNIYIDGLSFTASYNVVDQVWGHIPVPTPVRNPDLHKSIAFEQNLRSGPCNSKWKKRCNPVYSTLDLNDV